MNPALFALLLPIALQSVRGLLAGRPVLLAMWAAIEPLILSRLARGGQDVQAVLMQAARQLEAADRAEMLEQMLSDAGAEVGPRTL
jgi:hypothetical protein